MAQPPKGGLVRGYDKPEPSTFKVVYLILAAYIHPICANRCKSKSLLIDRFVFFLFVLDRSKSCACMNCVRKIEKTKQ